MGCKVIAMAYIEQWFGEFEKGNLYALATRAGVGKTHFVLALAERCYAGLHAGRENVSV